MKIAIIEDSPKEEQQLVEYLQTYNQLQHLEMDIDHFEDGESFLQSDYGEYDIIFIDIYLTGINGLEIAKVIRQKDAEKILIFTTTSKDHAVESYRVKAFDYLLKPYQYELLVEVMERCLKQLNAKSKYIQVKEGRIQVKVLLKDIIYTDYNNHYIQIHTIERMIKSYMPFDQFAPMLLCYPSFLNCYRNCIINMDKVSKMDTTDFLMDNQERIPIARAKRAEIRQQYADYQFAKLEGTL